MKIRGIMAPRGSGMSCKTAMEIMEKAFALEKEKAWEKLSVEDKIEACRDWINIYEDMFKNLNRRLIILERKKPV